MKTIAIESLQNVPEYTGFSNHETITIREGQEWDGHTYGFCVGMIKEDGTVKSCFKEDRRNGNTQLFDRLKVEMELYEKHCHLRNRDTLELYDATLYFILYRRENHCSTKPTVEDSYVDCCMNVQYILEYEILLIADEGLKRYLTVSFTGMGSYSQSFYDQLTSLEDLFEEWFEGSSHGFQIDEGGLKTVTFYDDIGESCDVELYSIRELLSMITSIRVIKCEKKMISDTNEPGSLEKAL